MRGRHDLQVGSSVFKNARAKAMSKAAAMVTLGMSVS